MGKDVFISYKSEEYNDALWLTEKLSEEGISTWMAPRDIPGGSSYAKEITSAIKGCKVFVLVLSPAAQESQWIPKEIDNAINENKLILPFMVKQCELNDEFKFFLSNIQFKEAYKNRKKALDELTEEIKAHLSTFSSEDDKDEEENKEEIISTQSFVNDFSEKEKINKQKKKEKKNKKNRKPKEKLTLVKLLKKILKITAVAVGGCFLVVIVISIIFIIYYWDQVTIAGNEYNTSDSLITIEEAVITSEDIAALSQFKRISNLSFINCTIDAPTLNFPELKDLFILEISGCNLTKEQFESIDLSKLSSLTGLNIQGNKSIDSITGFDSIKERIIELDISGTGITDISFLSGSKNLRSLKINELGIDSLSPLEQCIYLEELEAAINSITDIKGLENCTILRRVMLTGNSIENIDILSKSADTLEEVQISYNNISDISALEKCKGIKIFIAKENSIMSLSPLSQCTDLYYLDVADNEIESFEGINSKNLVYLDISGNKLTGELSISFPEDRSIQLFAANNGFSSVNIPKKCMYQEIDISGNPLSSADGLSDFSYLLQLTIDYNENFDFAKLGTSITDFVIINCPLDQRVRIEQTISGGITFEDRINVSTYPEAA